jgi:hypothetical protein
MTTRAAEAHYLAAHLHEVEDRGWVVFNPHNKPVAELPVIYGFNNGGSDGWYTALAMAQDGTVLGSHICSNEGYMPHDLGVLDGSRPDRHETDYQPHYPDGYRMEFVPGSEVREHEGLMAAYKLNQEMAKVAEGL